MKKKEAQEEENKMGRVILALLSITHCVCEFHFSLSVKYGFYIA